MLVGLTGSTSVRLCSARGLHLHGFAPVFFVGLNGCWRGRGGEAPCLPVFLFACYNASLHDEIVDDGLDLVKMTLVLAALFGHTALPGALGNPGRLVAFVSNTVQRLGGDFCMLHGLETDDDLAVAGIGVVFAHGGCTVGDDAGRVPLVERPRDLDGLASGQAVNEVVGQRWEAVLAQVGGARPTGELAGEAGEAGRVGSRTHWAKSR
jgi:hypothetical protein